MSIEKKNRIMAEQEFLQRAQQIAIANNLTTDINTYSVLSNGYTISSLQTDLYNVPLLIVTYSQGWLTTTLAQAI
jgi:hypothetical protein